MPSISYDEVRGQVIERLKCDTDRICDRSVALNCSFWPNPLCISDELAVEYGDYNHGYGADGDSIEKEYKEEVEAICVVLDELGYKPRVKSPYKDVELNPDFFRWRVGERIWSSIAVPLRRRGENVFRLRATGTGLLGPVIDSLPVDEFIEAVVKKTAADYLEIQRLIISLNRWKAATAILAVVGALLIALRL